ncbi:MAG: isoprenylcysteine carboxylmethyltransferase family protein [Chloroflexota bacterium]|jgi:protein-S-isoprenylcysteine O-methyltransferase Ste14
MLLFLSLFVLWAVAHSITASSRFKAWAGLRMGRRAYDGTYRLLYNGLAVVTLLPVLIAGALALPQRVLWEVGQPLSLVLVGMQLIGFVGLGISLLQTDIMRFIGLGQLFRYLRGDDDVNPGPILTTTGTYRLVRHPLYFFSLLVIWFIPVMTFSLLLFNIATTVYFWAGSAHEEKRLLETYGERYEAYRRRVPRILPLKIRS